MTTDGRGDGGANLWLVSHASTAWTGRRYCGRTDLALSKLGRREAAAMAARLAAVVPPHALIVSGPARRTRETAERLRSSLRGLDPVAVDGRTREVDFGDAEGLTFDQIAEAMPAIAAELVAGHMVDWPGGESASSVRERAHAVWLDLRPAPRPTLLVTHGGFIRALLEIITGRSSFPDLWIGPAAVIELARTGWRWGVVSAATGTDGTAA
jgi:broad specificity phosphatase PhoE